MKRRQRLVFFLILLAFEWLLASDHVLLYSVQGKNNNTVFLAGSIHLLTEEQYPLPPIFEKAFEQSPIIVFEINLDSAQTPGMRQALMDMGFFHDGTTLKQVLHDSTLKILEQTLTQFNQTLDPFLNMKPWLLGLTLSQLKMVQLRFKPELGLDRYFFQKAKEKGKEIKTLETPLFQLRLLNQLSKENPDEIILKTIEDLNSLDKNLQKLLLAWQKGNPGALDSVLNASFKDFPDLYRVFLTERNRTWLNKIKQFLNRKNNYLIVVGAGHLVGKDCLINMLKNAGYPVKQAQFSNF